MGRTTNKKRKNRAGGKGSAAASANGSALVAPLNLHLVAEPEFYLTCDSAGCPGSLKDHGAVAPGLLLVLDDVRKLGDLLGWFAAGASEDSKAKLDFPASLTSTQRAEIHRLVSGTFGDKLEAYSSGTGDARHISVCKKGCAPARELSAEQGSKVAVLYPLAKDAGLPATRDEIADVILQGQLPPALEELWQSSGRRLWLSQRLCNAAALGDVAALQALLSEDASVLRESVKEPLQGGLPLQAAATAGRVEALRALHAAGANLEAVDGAGHTALQAARRAEQCDAEAVLLQLGAVDPDADTMPVVAEEHGAGDEEAAGATSSAAHGEPSDAAPAGATAQAGTPTQADVAAVQEEEPVSACATTATEAESLQAEPVAAAATAGADAEAAVQVEASAEPVMADLGAPVGATVVCTAQAEAEPAPGLDATDLVAPAACEVPQDEAQVAAVSPTAEPVAGSVAQAAAAATGRSAAADPPPSEAATCGASGTAAASPVASTAGSICEQMRCSVSTAAAGRQADGSVAAAATQGTGGDGAAQDRACQGVGVTVGSSSWSTAASLGLPDKWLLLGTGVAACGAAMLLYRRLR